VQIAPEVFLHNLGQNPPFAVGPEFSREQTFATSLVGSRGGSQAKNARTVAGGFVSAASLRQLACFYGANAVPV
jgi:hypothetical protein